MLLTRQKTLLSLLAALSQPAGNTDFQKLLFLYTQEHEETSSYDFVPYRFGCFSFTSCADRRRLAEKGLLSDDEHFWELTALGSEATHAFSTSRERASRFLRGPGELRGDALIAEVYRRYPYYATRSEILDRVLPLASDRERVASCRPPRLAPGLLTIGYEGRSLEAYLNVLLRSSVTVLCDVRRNPLSRKYGFSKGSLSKACEGVGITYVHLPELGIASDRRRGLSTEADYRSLFESYERESVPGLKFPLRKIRELIERDGHRVALTCYEADPSLCHRHCVAAALEKMPGCAIAAVHL